MMQLKNILVPVDFSKEAELAVEWAVRLAKEERGSKLYLMHVFAPLIIVPEMACDQELVVRMHDQAKTDLEAWRAKVPAPLTSVTLYGAGDVVSDICAAVTKEKIDLIVMTTHGRHGLSRIAHPNLTEQVVRSASCPVLALHMNQKTSSIAQASA